MTRTVQGKIHGKTIEPNEDLGVAEGQQIEVQVTIVEPGRKWGEGILARPAAGWTTRKWMRSWRRFTDNATGACDDQSLARSCPW